MVILKGSAVPKNQGELLRTFWLPRAGLRRFLVQKLRFLTSAMVAQEDPV